MSMPLLLQTIEDTIVSVFGSTTTFALMLIIVFLIAFLFIGIDFRFAIMLVTPLVIAFSNTNIAWIPSWMGGIAWIALIGFGGYMVWTNIKSL